MEDTKRTDKGHKKDTISIACRVDYSSVPDLLFVYFVTLECIRSLGVLIIRFVLVLEWRTQKEIT